MRSLIHASLLCSVAAFSAQAETFKWASGTDPQTMDPHAVNSAPVLGFLNNVYEGLVRRDQTMAVEGALAESWEALGADGWRFKLRKGVTFHDGATFDAEDVMFSYERASSEAADTASWFSPVSEVKVVDPYTIDFMTKSANPLFPSSIANFMIMDKGWAEANDAVIPAKDAETFATRNANGTGAFMITERQPGLKTVLEPYSGWWGDATHNITRAEFSPIKNDATRIAALLSGEVDMINPVPIQDAKRLASDANTQVVQGIEARVIMLGFGHEAAELKYAADAGKPNPFQDVRVRRAIGHAVNVEAILATTMRGAAQPASQLVSPAMSGYSTANGERISFNLDQARALLAEAGYKDGFSFGLKCPNNRYLNDEAVCQAVVSMLAKVGISAELEAMPVANYWKELRADNYDMYLLGWSPGTLDAEHPIRFLVTTPNKEKKLGSWNFGGFSNARVDELLPMIQSEIEPGKRQMMVDEVAGVIQDEMVYVPLYVQPLVWGMRKGVRLTQRPDNFMILRWVNKS